MALLVKQARLVPKDLKDLLALQEKAVQVVFKDRRVHRASKVRLERQVRQEVLHVLVLRFLTSQGITCCSRQVLPWTTWRKERFA